MEEKKKGTGLKWVPISGDLLSLVPKYLIEQIEPRKWDVDRFYKLAPVLTASPFNLMGVFVDKANKVKGFMWATANPLDEMLHVHFLTVDQEYQKHGIIGEAKGILSKVKDKSKAKGLLFSTVFPEKFEKYGFKKSDSIMMEG
jgi:hypothetical protein